VSLLRRLLNARKRKTPRPGDFRGYTTGYRLRSIIFRVRDRLKKTRRTLRRGLQSRTLARHYARFETSVARRDWDAARREALAIADVAEQRRDAGLMEEMGIALMRLGAYERSGRLRLESRRIGRGPLPSEWDGGDIAGRTLLVNLVESDSQGLASTILFARLLTQVRARSTIAVVEERLLPLMRRSFPAIDVRTDAAVAADVVAGFEHLSAYFARDEKALAASFVPLRADPALMAKFRARYRADGRPAVGISWGSTAFAKEVPGLADWRRLLGGLDANFVSLQYGKVDAAIAELQAGLARPIIHDASVDQLADMDRFAAQVASLDAVISISNTGAHLAGALGVPSVIILDDNFRRVWPVTGDKTPWYPSVRLVAKKGRGWPAAMDEVRERVRALLGR
jgi:ADP-heptose:LPS heptosyltransferase